MKMKIAFIGGLGLGGSERVTANLANNLCKVEEVVVITGAKQKEEYKLSELVGRTCLMEGNYLQDCKRVKNFIRENLVDVVVGMSIYANLVVGGINSPAMKTKMIISERNDPRHDHISIKSKILRKLLYHRADFFVFQTKQEQQYYSKSIQKRSVIIHNMLKEDLPYRSQINAKKEIVAVGRFLPQKNYPMLLSAVKMVFEKHPQYILKIYGKGPLEKELKMKVTELGINDHVFFEGFHLDVHECMKDADIFVMSSDFEGLPNALMEAMAMGFPVVTTNCPAGGPEELITDGVNGMLVPVGDSQAMAEKINYLIENKEIKEEMGRKAVGIRETHTSEHICAAWRAILEA